MTDTGGSFAAEISVPPTHPALAGHFPGNPVVPGVLLLGHVLEAAEAAAGREWLATGMPQVKFLAALLPGEAARITGTLAGASLEFTIARGATLIARGVLTLAPVADAA